MGTSLKATAGASELFMFVGEVPLVMKETVPKPWSALIRSICVVNAKERPTTAQILDKLDAIVVEKGTHARA